jgi:hypothetical protein
VVDWCRTGDCPFRICEGFCVLNVSMDLLRVINQRLAYLVDSEFRSKFLSQSGRLGSQDWRASRRWFLHEDNRSFRSQCQRHTQYARIIHNVYNTCSQYNIRQNDRQVWYIHSRRNKTEHNFRTFLYSTCYNCYSLVTLSRQLPRPFSSTTSQQQAPGHVFYSRRFNCKSLVDTSMTSPKPTLLHPHRYQSITPR